MRYVMDGELTPEQYARRNAAIVRDCTHGAMSMAQVGRAYGITRQRVGQIVQRAQKDAKRAACERGDHGDIYRGEAEMWDDGSVEKVPVAWCQDCGARVV